MNYVAAVNDFFKSPKWMMNLLFGGLCGLIPIAGPMVIMGWLITGFWARAEERPETFPDFDFNHFGKYFERGLWPFLVLFLVSLVIVPVMFVVMMPVGLLVGMLSDQEGTAGGFFVGLFVLVMLLLYLGMMLVMGLLSVPLMLRASLTQDFAKSFDLAFTRRFISLTWKEIILSWLFLLVATFGFSLAGLLFFCVGVYFVAVPIYFAWLHLEKQIYAVYLGRGGEPVPLSPKLSDTPPPLPVT